MYIKPRKLDFSRGTVETQQKSDTVSFGFPEHSASNVGPTLEGGVRSMPDVETKHHIKGLVFVFVFITSRTVCGQG